MNDSAETWEPMDYIDTAEWGTCTHDCEHGGPMALVDDRGTIKAWHPDAPHDWQAHVFAGDSKWSRRAWIHNATPTKEPVRLAGIIAGTESP